MQTDRRAILSLVALGRITPVEAERLLIAWNDCRETAWIYAVCILALGLTQFHLQPWLPTLAQAAHAWLTSSAPLHGTLSLVTHWIGGVL